MKNLKFKRVLNHLKKYVRQDNELTNPNILFISLKEGSGVYSYLFYTDVTGLGLKKSKPISKNKKRFNRACLICKIQRILR